MSDGAKCDYCDQPSVALAGETNGVLVCEAHAQSAESVAPSEAYCVDSGRPVGPMGGDRCKSHGNRDTPCFVAFRAPRCEHPDWPRWANGSDRCPECRARVTSPEV